jgi:predicted dehydrogenase
VKTDESVRVGFVGLGRHSFDVLAHVLRSAPAHEVVAVCDIDPAKIDRFTGTYSAARTFTDYAEMFAAVKLDAVIVAVSHQSNLPILAAAIENDVHVFVEKTPVRSVAEADQLIELQRSSTSHVMVGFNRRFMSPYLEAKDISEREEFGGIHLYQSQFHATRYGEEAFKLNHIIHHLDLARFLLGEIELTQVQRVRVGEQLIGYTLSFLAASGAIGTIQAGSLLDARFPMERLELLGTGGNIVVDNLQPVVYHRAPGLRDDAGAPGVWSPRTYLTPQHNLQGYESEITHFIECVRDGVPPSPDLRDARRTLRLVERIDELLAHD